jgi:sugar lactone lactonase YvrE
MAGDIRTGEIYAVNVDTGASAVTIDNSSAAQTAPAVTYGFGSVATDGLRVRDTELYFSNVGRGTLVRVALNPDDGTPAGEAQTVAQSLSSLDQWDDFAIDCTGNAFITTGGSNTIQRVTPQGNVAVVAGDLNSTAVAEPASARFGRRSDDSNVLYVTTAGGMVAPVNGDTVVGAQVLAIRTNATSIC